MARLRKFVCYRRLERPNTRKSKYTKKAFVKVVPASKVSRYQMGNAARKFSHKVVVMPKTSLQIRHNALESARQTSTRWLEKMLTKDAFFIKMRVFPHHVLRENPLASGAGADRLSTGMAHSFGKSISIAAQVLKNKPLFEINVDEQGVEVAKQACKRIAHKVPCSCIVQVMRAT